MKKYYNILEYGAVAGSPVLQTSKIQAAIDSAFLDGGGEVVVPCGVFITGTLRLRSNVTFHMLSGAILKGSNDPEDYRHFLEDPVEPIDPDEEYDENFNADIPKLEKYNSIGCFVRHRWFDAIIKVYRAKNVKMIGDPGSVIDGVNLYDPQGEEGYRGPHAVQMTYCKNVEFGGITIKDCGNWAYAIYCSDNIFAHDLVVLGGHDGFHVRVCKNVLIEDCQFRTGDDCIAGFANENVVVRNCYLDCACSAFRFGGTDI